MYSEAKFSSLRTVFYLATTCYLRCSLCLVSFLLQLSNLGIMTARLLPALQECFKSEYVSVRIEAAMVSKIETEIVWLSCDLKKPTQNDVRSFAVPTCILAKESKLLW